MSCDHRSRSGIGRTDLELTEAVHSVAVVSSLVACEEDISETSRMCRRGARRLHTPTDELYGLVNIHQFRVCW